MTELSTAAVAMATLRTEILDLYLENAVRPYGLYGLNQLQHALQSAAHAEAQGLSSAMVLACLLHDVGHMIHDLGEAPAEDGIDDAHEALGANWAASRFVPALSEPIRLHVAAKRYLCTVDPSYEDRLAKDSRISLALQGGHMSKTEQTDFLTKPWAQDALTLRRIDELAKDKQAVTDPLEAFLARHLSPALMVQGHGSGHFV